MGGGTLEKENFATKQINIPFFNGVSLKDKVFFTRQLSTMIGAGLAIDQSFRVLANQAQNPKLKEIYIDIVRDLEQGKNLSYSLSKHKDVFDPVFIAVIHSGEGSGQLDQVLLELADRLEESQDFNSKLKAALMYPVFVVIMMIAIIFVMMYVVIPPLKDIFAQSGTALPFTTRVVVAISDFTVVYWWVEALVLAGLLIFGYLFFRSETGGNFLDNVKIKMPIFKQLYVQLYMSRFCRTISMLTRAGVPIIETLTITSDVIQNRVYARSLKNVISQVEKGIPISVPLFKDKNFPSIVSEMLMVGEQTGQMETILVKLAEYYERETNNMIKGMSGLIEPIIIVLLGLGVGFLSIAMLYPIYSLASTGF